MSAPTEIERDPARLPGPHGAERRRSLARWVEPRPGTESEVHLGRQWAAIRERAGRRRRSGAGWLAGGLGALALAAGAFALALVRPWDAAGGAGGGALAPGAVVSSAPGAVIESGAEPIAVRLADGSQIDLEPRTRLEAGEAEGRDVRLDLARGRASFEVARDPERRFAVVAGAVRVVVVGTRFAVERRDGRVEVRVVRGVVEVGTGARTVRLGAGETWSGADGAVRDDGELASIDAPPSAAGDDEGAERVRRPRQSDGASAGELFESAREARRQGRDAEAAAAYAELLRRHPRDGHAGLAAFELARIRMDVEGDPRGAIEPLERAIDARVFREDAMARLVRAYDESGMQSRCEAARGRYLEAYPEGVHVRSVQGACGAVAP